MPTSRLSQSPHLTRWAAFAFLAVCLSFTVACGDSEEEPKTQEPFFCATDDECGRSVCDVNSGQCVPCITDDHCGSNQECTEDNRCVDLPSTSTSGTSGGDPDAGDVGDEDTPDTDLTDTDLDASDTGDEDTIEDTPDVEDDVEDDVGEVDPTCGGGCDGLQTCNAQTGLCVSALLCTNDVDCAGAELCYRSQCLSPEDVDAAGGCSSDSVCTAQSPNLSCSLDRRVCRAFDACTTSDECPQGLSCLSGFCLECASDEECEGMLACDTASNSPTFGACVESAAVCLSDADCRGDRVCVDDQCEEPVCEDDFLRAEGGASCDQPIRLNDTSTYRDLKICGQTCDWFTLDLQSGAGAIARLLHDTQEGDLDIALYASCSNGQPVGQIASSATGEPDERVAYPYAAEPQQVLMSVCAAGRRPDDQGTASYNLDVLFTREAVCIDDVFDLQDPNDTAITATQLPVSSGGSFTAQEMRVCSDAPDWYRISAEAGEVVHVSADFDKNQGDLDLRVYLNLPSPFSAPAAVGNVHPGGESLGLFVPFAQDLYIEVDPAGPGAGGYNLEVNRQADCFDRLEQVGVDNNTWDRATPFEFEGETRYETGLTLCQREIDWYSVRLAPGEALAVRVEYDPEHGSDLFLDATTDGPISQSFTGSNGLLEVVLQGDTPGVPTDLYFSLSDAIDDDVMYSLETRRVPYNSLCVDDRLNNTSIDSAARGLFSVEGQRGVLCRPEFGIEPGEDWFVYDVEPGTTVRFEAATSSSSDPIVEVYDANRTQVATNEGSETLAVSWDSTDGGRLFVRVLATSTVFDTRYTLRAFSQRNQGDGECGEDRLEFAGSNPDLPNDTWENGVQLDAGRPYRNLVVCPSNTDWYILPVLGGIGYNIRILTSDVAQGAITAKLFGPLGPPDDVVIETVQSTDGFLEIDVSGADFIDGGLFALEVNSSGNTVLWYDILHTIGD